MLVDAPCTGTGVWRRRPEAKWKLRPQSLEQRQAEQLAVLIRRVGAATGMPVTYADVWGFWVKHRVLAQAVSFVTVHIIPYWDDDPVGTDRADGPRSGRRR